MKLTLKESIYGRQVGKRNLPTSMASIRCVCVINLFILPHTDIMILDHGGSWYMTKPCPRSAIRRVALGPREILPSQWGSPISCFPNASIRFMCGIGIKFV